MNRLTPESIRASQADLPLIGTGTDGATQMRRVLTSGAIRTIARSSHPKANQLIVDVMVHSPVPCLLPRWT